MYINHLMNTGKTTQVKTSPETSLRPTICLLTTIYIYVKSYSSVSVCNEFSYRTKVV